MFKKLGAVVIGALIGILAAAFVNSVNAADLNRSDRIDLLNRTTGEMQYNGSRLCTFSKVGPSQFLTAKHCIDGPPLNNITLKYQEPGNSNYYATTRQVDGVYIPSANDPTGGPQDWAVIYTDKDIEDMDSLTVDCITKPKVGDNVAYMGYPMPLGRTYGEGFVSSLDKTPYHGQLHSDFWTSMTINGGASGSPTINPSTGAVIGVVVEKTVGWPQGGVQFVTGTRMCKMVSPYLPSGTVRKLVEDAVVDEENVYSPF